jgi:periplasmic copper chaperone A
MKQVKWSTACIAVMATLVLPCVAGAHVTVQPDQADASAFVVESVRVPNEQDKASTTKVSVQFPAGFADVSFEPVAGWRAAVKKTRLAQPITTDEGDKVTEQVSQVTWTGGTIRPGEFQDFPMSLRMPEKPQTLTFKATQTYDNGDVVRWIGPPDGEEPAPQVKVAAAEGADATPAASTSDGGGDDSSDTLAIIALIVGGLGLIAGVAALLTRRRAT